MIKLQCRILFDIYKEILDFAAITTTCLTVSYSGTWCVPHDISLPGVKFAFHIIKWHLMEYRFYHFRK